MQRNILDYAAVGWQPWLSPSQLNHLEVTQNKCLESHYGQYANTSVELIRLEAGLPSYRTHSNRLIALAYEKGMRLDDNHPRKAAINKTVKHKLKTRSSFRERAKALISPLSISHAPRDPFPRVLPQTVEESIENWTIVTNQDIKHRDAPELRTFSQI